MVLQLGELIVLATGAHSVIADLFGNYVGADFVVSTKSEVRGGVYTMSSIYPIPYREGKSDLVFKYIKKEYDNLPVTVYTDEEKDLSLLKKADFLVGVNADSIISKYVEERGGKLVSFS